MGLQRRKVQDDREGNVQLRYSMNPFTERRGPSLHIFSHLRVSTYPQQPNHSAWMRGLWPSSTAKQKILVVHGCHSVPSIGQRRRFVGDKSGVTI